MAQEQQTILVCDDDKEIVDAISIYLSGEGFRVIKAYDGKEALRIMEEEHVDLIIMDVMMPELDGIHTTLKIRETSSVPIIILSAKSEDTDIFISIHQNSFPSEDVHGAQVFYKKDSEAGKSLAVAIQKRLAEVADVGNTRMAKADGSYYILKNSSVPSVIVECGFLSNDEEMAKLLDEEYRKHIAWAIYMGVMDYCGEGAV